VIKDSSGPRLGIYLCSGLRDGTETSSKLRRWSSACRTVWTHVAFGRSLYSVPDHGRRWNSLPKVDCCVTMATTLWTFFKDHCLSEY